LDTGHLFFAVTFGNGMFVAVGSVVAIAASLDGNTFRRIESNGQDNLLGIAYGEGRFVAVGNSGTILAAAQLAPRFTAVRRSEEETVALTLESPAAADIEVSSNGIQWSVLRRVGSGTADVIAGELTNAPPQRFYRARLIIDWWDLVRRSLFQSISLRGAPESLNVLAFAATRIGSTGIMPLPSSWEALLGTLPKVEIGMPSAFLGFALNRPEGWRQFPFEFRREAGSVSPTTGKSCMEGKKILVVDDEPMVLEATRVTLTHYKYSVVTVSNGTDALAMLEADEFGLVITDRKMPGMSGDELAVTIKSRWPQMPVILLTGYPPDRKPASVNAVLLKPFATLELRKLVEELLGKA
jgi:CheY-like chemotaxis protein